MALTLVDSWLSDFYMILDDSYVYIWPWEFPTIDNHGFSQPTVRHNLSQHELWPRKQVMSA